MRDLTVKQIEALKRPGLHRASRNLYVRVTGTGSRSWTFRFMREGRPRWHGLGSLELVTLAEAREKALDCRKLVLAGGDPIEAKREARAQGRVTAARAITFRPCAERYIAAHEAGRPPEAPGAVAQHARDLRLSRARRAAGGRGRRRLGAARGRADLDSQARDRQPGERPDRSRA